MWWLCSPHRSPALCRAKATRLIVVAAIGLIFASSPARAQISPGPLSKAHQSLTGTTQCASCHQFAAKTPTFRCLDCHKEIAKLLSDNRGFHAKLQMANPNGKDCVRCHSEHNGSDFPLIHWEVPVKQFDHRQTGYPLEGKHAGIACEKCHTAAHIASDFRPLMKRRDLTMGYLGQSPQCINCHEDYHKGQLGKNCESCHTVRDWKSAKQFDHSKTRYPLTGLHLQVKCESCHKPDTPGGSARFKGMQFGTCTACHSDPHRGEFKQKCEDCHSTASWKKLSQQFVFDHSKTKYPLAGEHQKVPCVACHSGGDFKKPLTFEKCMDCHNDIHRGQFSERPTRGECSECHTVRGWKPSLFGVTEHANSPYPLKGKHGEVACAKCHVPAGKETLYRLKFANCSDCHKDAHDGQFSREPFQNRCESCHTVADFHRSLYTIAMHKNTRFPLTGAHTAVACSECHARGKSDGGNKTIPFQFRDVSCNACHLDPHHGEFRERMERRRPNGTAFGCEACHNAKSWTEVNGFDHSKTSFPLLGAHRTTACGACHKVPTGMQKIQFEGTSKECSTCHIEPHGGQFKNHAGKTDCESCHDAQRWVPSTFDHDKRTKLPLQGGHAGIKCDQCHTITKLIAGTPVVFYKPTPVQCDACHGNLPPERKKEVPNTEN